MVSDGPEKIAWSRFWLWKLNGSSEKINSSSEKDFQECLLGLSYSGLAFTSQCHLRSLLENLLGTQSWSDLLKLRGRKVLR